MSCQVTVDDALMRQAREATGLVSDSDLVELGLRALIQIQSTAPAAAPTEVNPRHRQANPLLDLLDSDFIGCADSGRVDLSETCKSELTESFGAKYGHR